MDHTLWKIFDSVDSVLKYAESKNTYVLTFIGTQITIVRFLDLHPDAWLKISLLILGICVFLCIVSFFPKSEVTSWIYYLAMIHKKKNSRDNMLYFGDIVKYSVDEYIERMEKFFNTIIKGNEYQEQLCRQIVVNAGIAYDKFNIFKASFTLMFVGEIFFVLSVVHKI